jgi:hypothetical protein
MYYYVLNEYRVSNELLTEDIFVCSGPQLWEEDLLIDIQ